jgi:hypothetical protein
MMSLLRTRAFQVLDGVGDASRGQWEEGGLRAFHVRRRVSVDEEATVGPAVDIRGTAEQRWRFAKVERYLPRGMEPL